LISKGKRVALSMTAIYSRCSKQGECRLWNGALSKQGYPYITDPEKAAKRSATKKGGTARSGRILAWKLTHGTEPEGRLMLTCHNKLCLNPAHMVQVSERDKQRIMAERGCYDTVRHRAARLANSRANAKLDMQAANNIRALLGHLPSRASGRREAVLQAAQSHGVKPSTVYALLRGEYWQTYAAPNSSVWSMAA